MTDMGDKTIEVRLGNRFYSVDEEIAFNKGFSDAHSGRNKEDNPYNDDLAVAWKEGYFEYYYQ